MKWFLKCLQKYAVFTGRARRKEFWMFYTISSIIGFTILVLETLQAADTIGLDTLLDVSDSEGGIIHTLYSISMLIPLIAVGVRRMHDTDRSGWFILVPFYNFYLGCCDGTVGDNRFGTDSKDRGQSMGSQEPGSTYGDDV